jgi:cytoskeletal protein RodZ
MPNKTKNIKPKKAASMADLQKEQRNEQRMITRMVKNEQFMKWLLIGVIILLLLLILFAGYATDWLRGLSKDSTSGTDGVTTTQDAATGADGTTGTGATGTSTGTGSTNTSNTGSTNTGTKSSDSSNTSKETTSTTTNNSSTTNNNTTSTTPSSGLLSLYSDSSVGDNVSDILKNASLLGVSQDCHDELLIQVCDFTDGSGNLSVTTKNLLGTGILTSVTKNF